MRTYPEMDKEIIKLLDMEGMPLSVYAARCIEKLQAENAELRERLNRAVELPYERKRLLWGDKDKEMLLCPDCLTDIMGDIGDETFVVQCPTCGCFVDCTTEPVEFSKETEARLKELQGGER